jgi:hypothetical protein
MTKQERAAPIDPIEQARAHTDDDSTIREIGRLVSLLKDKVLRITIIAAIQARALLATR